MLQDDLGSQTQSTEGSYIPQGRDDILTQATGRSEHAGCVRGAGSFWGLRDYFGTASRRSADSCSQEVL